MAILDLDGIAVSPHIFTQVLILLGLWHEYAAEEDSNKKLLISQLVFEKSLAEMFEHEACCSWALLWRIFIPFQHKLQRRTFSRYLLNWVQCSSANHKPPDFPLYFIRHLWVGFEFSGQASDIGIYPNIGRTVIRELIGVFLNDGAGQVKHHQTVLPIELEERVLLLVLLEYSE